MVLMNVFELREKLIGDYSSFVRGFINIRENRIKELVEKELSGGFLWPDPLIQLSPFFEKGESIKDLIGKGILNEECERVFRKKEDLTNLGKQMQINKSELTSHPLHPLTPTATSSPTPNGDQTTGIATYIGIFMNKINKTIRRLV